MIFSGVAGAIIVSIVLGYTKKYKEVGVITLGLSVLCFIWFSQVSMDVCKFSVNFNPTRSQGCMTSQ